MDDGRAMALMRYQAISAYLAMDPPRGQRQAFLDKLAKKTWSHPDGRQVRFSAETLRGWVRRYRRGGLPALEDAIHPKRGIAALTEKQIELFIKLKKEVPERSLERLIFIAEDMDLVKTGEIKRSTLHRALQAHGLSKRPHGDASVTDLDRFEASTSNDLWQSDMLAGPWLPDPKRPKKHRRAWLYAFIDDHSRLLLAARFSFKGDLPALELVFREALQRHGVPKRVYYDNGATYRSKHMAQVVAELGIHKLIFTTPYRPQGHGKIEAFNRLCTSAFIAEVKASLIQTLDELNAALFAWMERFYNKRIHGETKQTPVDRWRADIHHVRHVDTETLRRAFLWRETRTPDKSGVFSLFGRKYQTNSELARKKIDIHYDPERLDLLEVWHDKKFIERVKPFEVQTHRRPHTVLQESPTDPEGSSEPTAAWLDHLTAEHQSALRDDPTAVLRQALTERKALDDAVIAIFHNALDDAVIDDTIVREWLIRFGPLDAKNVEDTLALLLPTFGAGQHIQHYLDAVHDALFDGECS